MSMDLSSYGRQLVDDDDVAAVGQVLRSELLTSGPVQEKFENELARKTNVKHCAVCSSGTAALHLAVRALDLGPGDDVIVPAITFLASANAAIYEGANVIFSDVDPDTGLMRDVDLLEALERSRNPKAAVVVHLNGQAADMPSISQICKLRGISVIEDACHALGTFYLSNPDGTFPVGSCRHSDMTVFSFHPVKIIAMGEGGAVTTNRGDLDERVRALRNHGIRREPSMFQLSGQAFDDDGSLNPWYHEMAEVGFNYRASELHCALGLSQLSKLGRFIAARRDLVRIYDRLLKPLGPIVRPIGRVADTQTGWHLYVVHIDFERAGKSRAGLMRSLKNQGIGTQVHYIPLYRQPYYRSRLGAFALPGAERYYRQVLSLPLFVGMTETDVVRVVDAVREILMSRVVAGN